MIQMEEGGLADDGKSFYFPEMKINTECSTGLDQYLLNHGIQVLVSVYALRHDTLLPCSIFYKLLTSQIELKRCEEELG